LSVGVFRTNINYRDIEAALLSHFRADIAFVSVSLHGTRAQVFLTETIPPPEIIDYSIPADIIAAKDGLIISIATSSGTPQVRPGDVVAAGDILVSGALNIGTDDTGYQTQYVRASSAVIARMYYRITFEVPLNYHERIYTGNIVRNYSILISDNEFKMPFFNNAPQFSEYDHNTTNSQFSFGRNYPMPIHLITTHFREYTRELQTRTVEEAMHFGHEQLISYILQEFGEDIEIIQQDVDFIEGNNSIKVEVFLITIERIDQIRELSAEILPEDENYND